MRLNRLMEKDIRVKFQRKLGTRFRQVVHKREEGVEKAWQCLRDNIKDVAEKVIGRNKKRGQRKATSWWNEDVRTRKNKNSLTGSGCEE